MVGENSSATVPNQSLACPRGFINHCCACVIEKHFTLDRSRPGPDHPFALEPDELNTLTTAVKAASASLGSNKRKLTDEANRDKYRRSIIAASSIDQGDTITEQSIRFARPGTGIEPKQADILLGMTATRDIRPESVIKWEDVR